jgi:hypothetical protein
MACLLAMTFYMGSSPGISQKPVHGRQCNNRPTRPCPPLKYYHKYYLTLPINLVQRVNRKQ